MRLLSTLLRLRRDLSRPLAGSIRAADRGWSRSFGEPTVEFSTALGAALRDLCTGIGLDDGEVTTPLGALTRDLRDAIPSYLGLQLLLLGVRLSVHHHRIRGSREFGPCRLVPAPFSERPPPLAKADRRDRGWLGGGSHPVRRPGRRLRRPGGRPESCSWVTHSRRLRGASGDRSGGAPRHPAGPGPDADGRRIRPPRCPRRVHHRTGDRFPDRPRPRTRRRPLRTHPPGRRRRVTFWCAPLNSSDRPIFDRGQTVWSQGTGSPDTALARVSADHKARRWATRGHKNGSVPFNPTVLR